MLMVSCNLINYSCDQFPDNTIFTYQFGVMAKDKTDQPYKKANSQQYSIIVDIVRSRITTWGFKNRIEDLKKVLYLYARKKLEEILSEFPEKKEGTKKLHTENSPKECPYDPKKIEFPPKEPFLIEVSRSIGF